MSLLVALLALVSTSVVLAATSATAVPVVNLGRALLVTDNAVTLTGNVNPNAGAATYTFQYGTTESYGLQTPVTPTAANRTVSVRLIGLDPGTIYYYRLVATNAAGTSASDGAAVVTLGSVVPPDGPPPAVAQTAAAKLTPTSVQFDGAVNPEGALAGWYFEYGRTTDYGLESAPQATAGDSLTVVSASITGLQPTTTYHFRLVASSEYGYFVGPDVAFTTMAVPPPYPRAFTLATRQVRAKKLVRVTVSGDVVRPAGVGAAGCTGLVTIAFERGGPGGATFAASQTALRPGCGYTLTTSFAASHLHGQRHFGVTATFAGNALLKGSVRRLTVAA